MADFRYTLEFDDRICATDMDLQTALILAEALAQKLYGCINYGAKIVIYKTPSANNDMAKE